MRDRRALSHVGDYNFTGTISGPAPTTGANLATKTYVDSRGAPYSAQTSAANVVTVLAATTYVRLTGTQGQTADFPSLATMTDGATIAVRDVGGNAGTNEHTLLAFGSDSFFDNAGAVSSLVINDNGGSMVLRAVLTVGWERIG